MVALIAFVATQWKFLSQTFCSDENSPSSKRLIAFLFSLVIVISALAAVFMKLLMPEFMWNSLLLTITGCLGLGVVEKFIKKPDIVSPNEAKKEEGQ